MEDVAGAAEGVRVVEGGRAEIEACAGVAVRLDFAGRLVGQSVCGCCRVGFGTLTVSNCVAVTIVVVVGTPVCVIVFVGVKVAVTMLCDGGCVSGTWSACMWRGLTPSVTVAVIWDINLVVAGLQSVEDLCGSSLWHYTNRSSCSWEPKGTCTRTIWLLQQCMRRGQRAWQL